MDAKIITAAHVYVYINGKLFGNCAGFRWDPKSPSKPLAGLDTLETVELMPTSSNCDGTMTVYKLRGDGGAEGIGIAAPSAELPRSKYFNFTLVDRLSQTIIFQADYCRVNGQSWNMEPKRFIMGTIQWSALSWSNEVRPLVR